MSDELAPDNAKPAPMLLSEFRCATCKATRKWFDPYDLQGRPMFRDWPVCCGKRMSWSNYCPEEG